METAESINLYVKSNLCDLRIESSLPIDRKRAKDEEQRAASRAVLPL
jgi:hypothetical protein